MSGRGGRGRGGRGGSAAGRATMDLIRDNYDDIGIERSFNVGGFGNMAASLHHGDRLPPALYPQINLVAPMTISPDEMFCVQKMIDIQCRNEASAYYLKKPAKSSQNNVRYSDRYKSALADRNILDYIYTNNVLPSQDTNKRKFLHSYFPAELSNLKEVDPEKTKKAATKKATSKASTDGKEESSASNKKADSLKSLHKLEQKEKNSKHRTRSLDGLDEEDPTSVLPTLAEEEEEEKKEEEEEVEVEEVENDDDDYNVDYYASEDEGGGGSDADDRGDGGGGDDY